VSRAGPSDDRGIIHSVAALRLFSLLDVANSFVDALELVADAGVSRLQVVQVASGLLALPDGAFHVSKHVRVRQQRAALTQLAVLAQ